MRAELRGFSLVVLGEAHNPTLLNPDFLTVRQIVPSEWGWQVNPPVLTTPLYSIVRYANGISISLEPHKLQVMDPCEGGDPRQSPIVGIVARLTGQLPHVRYTALGINFQSLASTPDPVTFLKARFLKAGPWDTAERPVQAAAVRFGYPIHEGKATLTLDTTPPGKLTSDSGSGELEKPVVWIGANFHREWSQYPGEPLVRQYLDRLDSDWACYRELLDCLLGSEPALP